MKDKIKVFAIIAASVTAVAIVGTKVVKTIMTHTKNTKSSTK